MNSNIYNFFLHITVTELCWDIHSQGSRLLELAVVVQLLSCIWLFVTMDCGMPGFVVLHVSRSLLKFMSIELVMLFNHLILCHPLLLPSIFPSIRVFSNELAHQKLGGQSIGAPASVLPMNFQGWFPFGLTGLISLSSKGLSRIFSSTTAHMIWQWWTETLPWVLGIQLVTCFSKINTT